MQLLISSRSSGSIQCYERKSDMTSLEAVGSMQLYGMRARGASWFKTSSTVMLGSCVEVSPFAVKEQLAESSRTTATLR